MVNDLYDLWVRNVKEDNDLICELKDIKDNDFVRMNLKI